VEVEWAVATAENAASQAQASEQVRPQVELPGAVRWLCRRVHPVHQCLVILKGLLADQFSGCEPTIAGFAERLGVTWVLPVLREIGAPYLQQLPPPLGFCPPRGAVLACAKSIQQSVGADPPLARR
jgi:hypothetical protein